MKYSEAQDVAAGLREFADWVEQHGVAIPHFYFSTVWVNNNQYDPVEYRTNDEGRYEKVPGTGEMNEAVTKAAMAKAAKAMKPCEKVFQSTDLELTRTFGGMITLKVYAKRDIVCERVQVGEKLVPAREPRIIEGEPEHTEPVYEYICDTALLA
jgi:hypothetical protein